MAFNPTRDAPGEAARLASRLETSFRPEADDALSAFLEARDGLRRQVGLGDLTPKVARERARAAAAELAGTLRAAAEVHEGPGRAFLRRVVAASEARKVARDRAPAETLQRETNRLLRLNLIEQQVASRSAAFEARAFSRTAVGKPPVATLDGLLTFHRSAELEGDEAALEWARRQLEVFRDRTVDDADRRRIDLATGRPDRVNPRLADAYVEALEGASTEALEAFVAEANDGGDANACVAAFRLARGAPEGTAARWVRQVLDGLKSFPDAALAAIRAGEAAEAEAEATAARAHAEAVAARALAEARLEGLEAPSSAELARQARSRSAEVAPHDRPVGLAPGRRWPTAEETVDFVVDGNTDPA